MHGGKSKREMAAAVVGRAAAAAAAVGDRAGPVANTLRVRCCMLQAAGGRRRGEEGRGARDVMHARTKSVTLRAASNKQQAAGSRRVAYRPELGPGPPWESRTHMETARGARTWDDILSTYLASQDPEQSIGHGGSDEAPRGGEPTSRRVSEPGHR